MTDRIQNDSSASRAVMAIALLMFVMAGVAAAQAPEEVIRIDTELVSFEVTVTDQNGKPMPNLSADEFRVFDDGIERRIDFFEPIKKESGRPLSVVFALDVSGSMTEDELGRLRYAMQSFLSRLADYNSHFAVVSFAMEVKTLQGFTNRREKLEK